MPNEKKRKTKQTQRVTGQGRPNRSYDANEVANEVMQ